MTSRLSGPRSTRPLLDPGVPAPFWIVMPAYLAALAGWLGATGVLVVAAPALADGAIGTRATVLAAHLVALVLFPFGVAAAVWQLLPMLLRNDLPRGRYLLLALVLLCAGAPLAIAIAVDAAGPIAIFALLLVCGFALLFGQVGFLILRVPRGRLIIVSRLALAFAGAHAVLAFVLGATAANEEGREQLGLSYERLLLVHLSLALIGWLTVLIAVIGRTLVPMLGLGAAASRRRLPAAELTIVAGLWCYIAGLVVPSRLLIVAGIVVMAAGVAPVARLFLQTALGGRIGAREGPTAHAVLGLFFLGQAGLLGLLAAAGALDERRATSGAVALLGIGWAAGMVVGHLGKLVSLSGWGSWPPGPRPSQAELYPRLPWQLEAALFAPAVELLAGGIVFGAEAAVRAGAVLLVGAALAALVGAGLTVVRVISLRRTQVDPAPRSRPRPAKGDGPD